MLIWGAVSIRIDVTLGMGLPALPGNFSVPPTFAKSAGAFDMSVQRVDLTGKAHLYHVPKILADLTLLIRSAMHLRVFATLACSHQPHSSLKPRHSERLAFGLEESLYFDCPFHSNPVDARPEMFY
jgi:hypothetical protein